MRKLLSFRRREYSIRNSRTTAGDQIPHDNTTQAQPQSAPSTTSAVPSTAKSRRVNTPLPYGVSIWRQCPDATVDICFVHGLSGNRDNTWTAHGQSVPWPASLLPPYLPKARLLTYGYDAYVVPKSATSRNRLLDHARNLINDLTNERRDDASSRPIIFVAHSLGGLVCKEAILLSRHNPELHLEGIFNCFRGIIFIGTPHRGAWAADWAKIPASALGLIKPMNKTLLSVLGTDNELLELNQIRFWSMVRQLRETGKQIDVTCFYEELPLGKFGVVVSKESATLEGYNSISIHANHRDMVKIGSADENSFKRLLGELIRWEQSVAQRPSTLDVTAAPQCAVQAVRPAALRSERLETGLQAAQRTERIHCTSQYIPFSENKEFVGRTSVIKDLKAELFKDDDVAPQRVALVGLGGVGKTQVALQLAFWTLKNKPAWSVFWVPVLSQESFEQSCRAIAEELGLGGGDEKDVRQLLQRYLRSKESGHWLLIIDNADDEEVIFGTERGACGVIDFLPRNDQGRVLFTTRYQRMASRVARSKIFELVEMGKGDAHDLMEKSLANKDLMRNDQGVTKLLEALTYLPLAIVQAAAYLNENKESIDEYIRLLENTEQDMVELLTTEFTDDTRYGFTNDTRFGDTHNAVASTWAVSFEQIRKDGDAASLLLFMSFVEPKDIPRLLLPSVGSEQRMTRAIGMLCGYSFLSRRKDGNSYDMHRLVHIASRAWVKTQSDAKDRKRTALKHLETIFQTDDWEDRKRWRPYMPHVMRAIETGKKENNWEHEERHLGFWMGRCLIAEGRIREAMGLLEYLVAVQETALPESHSDRLVSQQVLASACLVDGQVEKAIELLEHVVAVQETTLAESHSDRLTSQHALAGAYQADGQMQKAIGLLEQVVAIQETALAESHPDQLASQHELARAYHDDGQVKRAIGLLEYVVASRKATLAEAHPDRLASEHELARAYRTDGQIKKAIELLERVGIQESTLAESHPDRLVSQHVLASLYLIDGQAKKAIELLRHIITVQETVLVEAHPDRLALQQELARAYLADGQIKKAIALFEYLVAFHKAVLAESHPDRLALQNELAKAYQANGQVTKAIELFEHVVAVRERVLAESDPNRLAAQHHLALAYLASLQVEKAIGLLEHVVAIEKHTLAEDDKSRLISESALKQARDAYHHTPWSGGGWV